MGEQDALVLLANVALHEQCKSIPVYRKRRETRPKELKIIHSNGSDVAQINDLKNLPLSVIFKIFIEKSEDANRHCTVYVCKFNHRNGCNTKFMDVQESKVNRLEHLIQCHLLEHLLKTKPGSLVEIPKKSLEKMKTKESMTEIDNSKSSLSSFPRNDQHATKVSKVEKPIINENIRPINDKTKIIAKMNKLTVNDHTYATHEERKSSSGVTSDEEFPVVKSDIKIDDYFLSMIERSEELSSFMLQETLYQPVNIFIIDGSNLIVEKLPIVGSEVEISTSCNVSKAKNSITPEDKINYTCAFCTSSYQTKKSLNVHVRKKHSDMQEKKEIKEEIIAIEGVPLIHDHKTSKKMRMLPSSDDASNNWFVELKENLEVDADFVEENGASILKSALTKDQAMKRPIINISNVWNNIHVQYI